MSVFKVGSNKSSQNNFPSVRPTLDLDFANSKTLDPRITFTRASGGSYVGADGLIKLAGVNEPRFDHDPVTGESLGLLVEEARTNLCPYSEDIANAGWTKVNSLSVTKETINGPGGLIPYDKLALGTFTNNYAAVAIPFNLTASTLYSTSIYLKAGTCRYAILVLTSQNSVKYGAYFDLQTGTMANNRGSQTYAISSVGNGWYKVSIVTDSLTGGGGYWGTWILPSPTNSNESRDYVELTDGFDTYNAAGEYLYAFASQCEAGAFPTSYIPTTSATVTRAADAASITGTNFSSWYNQSSGSVVVNVLASQGTRPPVAAQSVLGITPSVGVLPGNLIYQNTDSNGAWYTYDSGILELVLTIYLNPNGNKFAWGLTAGASSVGVKDGATRGSYSWSSIVRTGFLIGTENIGSIRWKRITYYPKRLPDAQLQVLTR